MFRKPDPAFPYTTVPRLWMLVIILFSFTAQSCSILPFFPGSEKKTDLATEPSADQIPEGVIEVGKPGPPSPYFDIITEEAVSRPGMFDLHQVGEKLYFEIPDRELGREMLLVSRIVQAQAGTGYGGVRLNNYVLRWVKQGEKVLLRSVLYQSVADTASSVYQAVRSVNFEPIIASFDIKAIGPDSTSSLIEVTRLFTTDIAEFSPRERYRGRLIDSDRSYIHRFASFPDNIEVSNVITISSDHVPAGGHLRTISLKLNHSFLRLPEEPMRPRLHDDRVGYYSVRQVDYSRPDHQAVTRRYITRWRLEKKHEDSELSEPVKPIVFYVDPGTPEFLQDFVKQGIEDWQPAFEQAGFKNAIIGKKAPQDDPEFSMEDARYSMIRWMPSTTMNAYGPHVHDPRSGEIITSSVGMFHNVQNLLRNWYFVQTGAVDERNLNLPLPDSLMGRLIRYVVAHEVGHALGLPHNMKASSAVPTDSLRSATFTCSYGTTPSIMDYARMNYVAQPGDGACLIPVVSIYDKFSVEWGYRPLPQASTADEERLYLDAIARRQEAEPMLRFGHFSSMDPRRQTEALGDNHVQSTRYGIANLKRIMSFIVDAASREGEDYATLQELYDTVVWQRNRMLGHVVNWVGGVYSENKVYGQPGPLFHPVPRARQIEALEYLLEEGFTTPYYLVDPDVLDLIQPTGSAQMIQRSQRSLLFGLMNDERLLRMAEIEASRNQDQIYGVDEMLTDLREGIWQELKGNEIRIDFYRRNLQRAYLEVLEIQYGGVFFRSSGESAAMIRGQLRILERDISRAIPRASDSVTLFHLEDIQTRLRWILDPD